MNGFHEILFPLDVGFGASGGPERRTDIVRLASGHEERNARWADSRRSYDAGLGVRSLNDLQSVLSFFEERRGRLFGFRFRDPLDCTSCAPGKLPEPLDQNIATTDGTTSTYQLRKTYGDGYAPYERVIHKPVESSVRLALDGVEIFDFDMDAATGVVSFHTPPTAGAILTAGYRFDVSVRFDTDRLEFSLSAFEAGDIPSIPLTEIRL